MQYYIVVLQAKNIKFGSSKIKTILNVPHTWISVIFHGMSLGSGFILITFHNITFFDVQIQISLFSKSFVDKLYCVKWSELFVIRTNPLTKDIS